MFYRLVADPRDKDRWQLSCPRDDEGFELDPRQFTQGKYIQPKSTLTVGVRRLGRKVDFNFGDFDMLVARSRVGSMVQAMVGEGIQRISARVEGEQEIFEILNPLVRVKCVDEAKSEFLRWGVEDGRPDKVGQYRMITRLRLMSSAIKDRDFFRVDEWPMALIVSDRLKSELEHQTVTGIAFEPALEVTH